VEKGYIGKNKPELRGKILEGNYPGRYSNGERRIYIP
jgi:hypothetical protein